MFYDRYVALCQKHGVSPSRAALDAGLSKSTVTKWKNDPNALPTGNVIDKLIRYFGVSVSDLLGESNLCADPEARKVEPVEIRTTLPGKTEPFYDRFLYLARCKGVSPSKAALDAGGRRRACPHVPRLDGAAVGPALRPERVRHPLQAHPPGRDCK